MLEHLKGMNLDPPRRSALDFGCGVGRLTQALADHFDSVHGVDIAPSMVVQARELNRKGPSCVYTVNDRSDLRLFENETFDFVYASIVLQHMKPAYAFSYVAEFVRLLSPDGVAAFQMPEERPSRGPRALLRQVTPHSLLRTRARWRQGESALPWRLLPSRTPIIEDYCSPRETVVAVIAAAGGFVREATEWDSPVPRYKNIWYFVTRDAREAPADRVVPDR